MAKDDIKTTSKSISFAKLLEGIEGLDDNRKRLFREVYENAIDDRARAVRLFDDLSEHVGTDVTSKDAAHTLHGQTLSRYLERMHKSTEQLLKLSELIAESIAKRESEAFADAFDQISEVKD